jgi:hypothetical protein
MSYYRTTKDSPIAFSSPLMAGILEDYVDCPLSCTEARVHQHFVTRNTPVFYVGENVGENVGYVILTEKEWSERR